MATALGGCMLTIMGIAARTLGVTIDGATVEVEKEMTPPPRRIGTLRVVLHMPAGIAETHRRALEDAAMKCPVHKSLHTDISIPVTFDWK